MGLKVITPPSAFPVSLAEAKDQVRVIGDQEDALIGRLIRVANSEVERSLSMSIAEQTLELSLDTFSDSIELLRGPVKSVTSVKYTDGSGVDQTAAADLYTVDLVSSAPWLVRNASAVWPATLDAVNAVRIRYVAGMAAVPEDLQHAMLVLISHWYANREGAEVPNAVESLIENFRTEFL